MRRIYYNNTEASQKPRNQGRVQEALEPGPEKPSEAQQGSSIPPGPHALLNLLHFICFVSVSVSLSLSLSLSRMTFSAFSDILGQIG